MSKETAEKIIRSGIGGSMMELAKYCLELELECKNQAAHIDKLSEISSNYCDRINELEAENKRLRDFVWDTAYCEAYSDFATEKNCKSYADSKLKEALSEGGEG